VAVRCASCANDADEVREGVTATQATLAKVDPGNARAVAWANEARSKLAFVVMDNSKGMHNIGLTRQLLTEARALADRAVAR
jgi:hypothetical protein